jgi:hypothetical protein
MIHKNTQDSKCTYHNDGHRPTRQPLYSCQTCWGNDPTITFGCCPDCRVACHRGHQISKVAVIREGFVHGASNHKIICTRILSHNPQSQVITRSI